MTPLATRRLAERARAGQRERSVCGRHAQHPFTAAPPRQIIWATRDRGFARFAGLKLFDPASA